MAVQDRISGGRAPGNRPAILLALLLALVLIQTCAPTPDRVGPSGIPGIAAYQYSEPLFAFAVLADPHVPDSGSLPPGDDYLHLKALSIAEALLAN